MVQSLLINGLALWIIAVDQERFEMEWMGRIWGYDGATGMVQGLALGYFLWDVMVSSLWFGTLGAGSLVHAICAVAVTSLGFRPFANYYGLNFILYELSTPFLNVHWFCDKLGMTGSRVQLVNGILLLMTFFGCRLVWGTMQSVHIYQDMLTAWDYAKLGQTSAMIEHAGFQPDTIKPGMSADMVQAAVRQAANRFRDSVFPMDNPLMRTMNRVHGEPMWSSTLAVVYLAGNTILSVLNFYWFYLMVLAVVKRFVGKGGKPGEKKKVPEWVKRENELLAAEARKDAPSASAASSQSNEKQKIEEARALLDGIDDMDSFTDGESLDLHSVKGKGNS